MKKFILTLSAAVFVFGALALPASAQNEQRGAASIRALKKATPLSHRPPVAAGRAIAVAVRAGSAPARRAAAAACLAGNYGVRISLLIPGQAGIRDPCKELGSRLHGNGRRKIRGMARLDRIG